MQQDKTLLSSFALGDMILTYVQDQKTNAIGMRLLPQSTVALTRDKYFAEEPLVQAKLLYDDYPGGFSQGRTMRGSATMNTLRWVGQTVEKSDEGIVIKSQLTDDRGYAYIHTVSYRNGSEYLAVHSTFCNHSEHPATLEMLTSFTLGGLTIFSDDDGPNTLELYRLRSCWSAEGRLIRESIEQLHLEPSWTLGPQQVEHWGQVGSLPVKGYFPFAAVHDKVTGVIWAVELTNGSSWQLEAGRHDQGFSLAGGQADRECGHWMKTVQPGETFTTEDAILTCCIDDVDSACERLQGYTADRLQLPESETDLPVLFNEYCTTWGMPHEDVIAQMVDCLKGRGMRYFVIDAGWYAEEPGAWVDDVGSWNVSKQLFSRGMADTVRKIREGGMLPGIWFEMESIGCHNPMFHKTEWQLHRDGIPLTVGKRRFWDLRLPQVQEYLHEKVIEFLRRYGFQYIKIDYNDTLGIGVDGCESLGEGLRAQIDAVQHFMRRLRQELPDVVLEICSSGGHRIVPSFLTIGAMASFSDAHECDEIPVIAANMHRMILPRQSQIWAVIHADHDEATLYYKLTGGMLGRLCLSGDILHLNEWQWNIIEHGIAFYSRIAPVINHGKSHRYGPELSSWRHPSGWQAIVREGQGLVLAVVHTFADAPETLRFPIPAGYAVAEMFARSGVIATMTEQSLVLCGLRPFDGCAVLMSKTCSEI